MKVYSSAWWFTLEREGEEPVNTSLVACLTDGNIWCTSEDDTTTKNIPMDYIIDSCDWYSLARVYE